MISIDHALHAMQQQLAGFQSERAIRNLMGRYMLLCDQPCGDTAYPQLADLFAVDATWEGGGRLYAQTFGRHSGRAQIAAFLRGYLAPSPHFRLNVHFLTSEQLQVDGACARGQWVMLQASTYEAGHSELVSARLAVDFSLHDGAWQISHFRTSRLFNLACELTPPGGAQ